MKKVIRGCPWGYPTNKICIYFSWKEAYSQIPDHYGLSILQCISFTCEDEKAINGGLLKSYIL